MSPDKSTLNHLLVRLFNEILSIEGKALCQGRFSNLTIRDMHLIEAIGDGDGTRMSDLASFLSLSMGTLTVAVDHLIEKGYVYRSRDPRDRRVVLAALTKKGRQAFDHHARFHEEMVEETISELSPEETDILIRAMDSLRTFFEKRYQV
jgi:DNA-binding MarR family transcriptional regulator